MTEKTIFLPPKSSENGNDTHYRLTMMVPKRHYLACLQERWWVVLVCLSLAVGGILVLETLRSESYTSYAQLYTSGEVQLNVGNIFSEEEQTYYGTQIELLKSARIQNAALERIGYVPKAGETIPVLDVVRPMSTSILRLNVTASDPNVPQRFLQAVIDEYLAYKKDARRTTSEDIVLSLTDQLEAKEKDLKADQEKWAEFEKSNNFAVLEEESRGAGTYLSDLELQLSKYQLEHDLRAAGLNPTTNDQVAIGTSGFISQTNETGLDTSNAPAADHPPSDFQNDGQPLSSDSLLKSAKVELAELRAQRDLVLAEHGAGAARTMDDSVTNLEQRVAVLESINLDDNKTAVEQLDKRMAAINKAIPDSEQKVLQINERLVEAQRLKNNIQQEQDYYDHLLTTVQSVNLGQNVQPERLSVLQPPTPAAPVKRSLSIRIFIGGIFGLAAGLGLVFCWYLLDDRFVSVRDIKDQFGESVLGLVPQISVDRSKPELALLQANEPRLAYAESYRQLRSALLLSSWGETRPQTLLFTSSVPAEGKTTLAVNLARVLADSGLRVAVVDADSQNGRLHQLLGTQNVTGMLDYLRGDVGLDAVAHPTGLPGLNYVPVGTHPEQADGLFLRASLGNLLAELKTSHDFVILDGAPILGSAATAHIVPLADAVIMVVRPFFSRARLVRQALDMLYQRQAKEVSIIFNRARKDDLAGHYAQYGQKRPSNNGIATKE